MPTILQTAVIAGQLQSSSPGPKFHENVLTLLNSPDTVKVNGDPFAFPDV